ncbi:MAG: hypothetical protein LIO93_05560 [Bacteroidales bacterium]|nr:hypothetical protein [Bacteroidales bacterium]
MKRNRVLKSIWVWLTIAPLFFLQASLRDLFFYYRIYHSFLGIPLEDYIWCISVFLLSLVLIPRLGRGTLKEYILMGLYWMLLTLVFVFCVQLFWIGNMSFMEYTGYFLLGFIGVFVYALYVGVMPILIAKIKSYI